MGEVTKFRDTTLRLSAVLSSAVAAGPTAPFAAAPRSALAAPPSPQVGTCDRAKSGANRCLQRASQSCSPANSGPHRRAQGKSAAPARRRRRAAAASQLAKPLVASAAVHAAAAALPLPPLQTSSQQVRRVHSSCVKKAPTSSAKPAAAEQLRRLGCRVQAHPLEASLPQQAEGQQEEQLWRRFVSSRNSGLALGAGLGVGAAAALLVLWSGGGLLAVPALHLAGLGPAGGACAAAACGAAAASPAVAATAAPLMSNAMLSAAGGSMLVGGAGAASMALIYVRGLLGAGHAGGGEGQEAGAEGAGERGE